MALFDFVSQQGSVDWMRSRAGIPTASMFDKVMTPKTMKPSESRKKYAMQLLAERIMRYQADSLDHVDAIAAGKANEPDAVRNLELVYGIETTPVGFVTTDDGRFGASPDRLVGFRDMPYAGRAEEIGKRKRGTTDTVVEVKAPGVLKQFEYMLIDDDAYKCQRQGQLYVCEADKAIFFSYNPRMPVHMVEDGRDESFIAKLADCLERFSDELEAWEAKAKSLGFYDPFPELLTPVDATYTSEERMEKDINGTQYDWGA